MATSDIYNQQMSVFENSPTSYFGNYGWWNALTGEASAMQTSNRFAAEQAALANQFSHDEAALTRDWNERMSNTQYQRAMADMKAAGINPLNMAGGIEPASASTSATASAHQGQASNGGSSPASFIVGLLKIGASLATAGASNAAKIQSSLLNANAKENAATISAASHEKIAGNKIADKNMVAKIHAYSAAARDAYDNFQKESFAGNKAAARHWYELHNNFIKSKIDLVNKLHRDYKK